MPNSLMDMSWGLQPMDPMGQPTGFGNALTSRANSLTGMGMGLLSGGGPLGWQRAMEGYQAGAALDARSAQQQQQLQMERARLALAQQQANREPEAIRQLRAAGVPQEKWAELLYPKQGTQWHYGQVPDPETERQYPYAFNPNTGEEKWPMGKPPFLQQGGGTPGAAPSGGAVAPVVPGTTLYWPGQQSAQTPSTTGAAITQPDWRSVLPPEAQSMPPSKQRQIATQIIEQRSKPPTEEQSKASSFATRMENAEASVAGLENQGTNTQQRAIENYTPDIIGRRLLTPEYQRYTTARSQFITALLRRESGAAVSPHEFERYDREFFPQPGDSPQQIIDKKHARKVAIENMKRSAGSSYQSPEPPPPFLPSQQSAPSAPSGGRTGGAAVPTQNWTRDANGNLVRQ
jgi:hypothetical protein